MIIRNAYTIATLLFVATFVVRAGEGEDVQPELDMQVTVLDAGRRVLAGDTFVRGEPILVKVRLLYPAALDEMDRHARETAGGENAPFVAPDPIPLTSGGLPWPQRVTFTSSSGNIQPRPVAGVAPPVEQLADSTVEYWIFETADVQETTASLDVSLDQQGTLRQSVAFALVAEADAPASELSRVAMRRAQSALDDERYDEAASIALEAIRLGPAKDIDLSTLQQIRGAALEALGDAPGAIAAYEAAIEAIERSHPGRSRLPTVLTQRIRRLQGQ